VKLKILNCYSQRDSQWASKLLGFNTQSPYTIGKFGCLITCYGMYVNKNPGEINELLKANNGFTAGSGNFIWSKCAVLGLNETYLSPFYNEPVSTQGITKMKALLDEGRPLVCHIDFDPSDPDDDQHWLLIIGYDEPEVFYAADPYTGTIITLDVYGGARRCIYQWRAYDKTLPVDEVIDYKLLYEKMLSGLQKVCGTLNIGASMDILQAEVEKLIKLEDLVTEKEKKLEESQVKIQDLQGKLDSLMGNQLELKEENTALKTKIEEADDKIKDQGTKITDISNELKELSQKITVDGASGWQLIFLGIKKLLMARG
jgi:uncharacterized Fe-S cluster-containing radical SAM superfamily protein